MCAFDLGKIDKIPELVRNLRKEFGPLFGLVNNAALGLDGALSLMHNSQIEELVRVNTLSPIVLTKYVVRAMMSERKGRIVNVASIIGFTGYSGLSVYAATKASMLGFTRSLAREVGRLGITVNAVAPGFLDTEMTHGLAGEQREQVMRRSALRRLAGVDDVAECGRISAQRQGAQHFRHGADGRCRRDGLTDAKITRHEDHRSFAAALYRNAGLSGRSRGLNCARPHDRT